jgi:hypothetical protein
MSNRNQNKSNRTRAAGRQQNTKGLTKLDGPAAPVDQPVSSASLARSGAPKITRRRDGGMLIDHWELVTPISGGAGVPAMTLEVNPGLDTYPFLSEIAKDFQEWRPHEFTFHFLTRESTAEKGTVVIAPTYDAVEEAPFTEVAASALMGAVSNVLWANFPMEMNTLSMLGIAGAAGRLFVRSETVQTDVKNTYDGGKVTILSPETPSEVIGNLWVHYVVEFFAPGPHHLPLVRTSDGMQFAATGVKQVLVDDTNTNITWDLTPGGFPESFDGQIVALEALGLVQFDFVVPGVYQCIVNVPYRFVPTAFGDVSDARLHIGVVATVGGSNFTFDISTVQKCAAGSPFGSGSFCHTDYLTWGSHIMVIPEQASPTHPSNVVYYARRSTTGGPNVGTFEWNIKDAAAGNPTVSFLRIGDAPNQVALPMSYALNGKSISHDTYHNIKSAPSKTEVVHTDKLT